MRTQLFTLTLLFAFLGAPLPGALAADGCPPCCTRSEQAPCESGAAPCVSLSSAGSCCDVEPAAPASQAGHALEAPGSALAALPARPPTPADRHAEALRAREVAARLPSPLQLSVVLIL